MEYLLPVFCLRYNIPLACLLQRHEISAACLLVEIYFNIGIMPATVLQPHSVECDHGLDLSLFLHYDNSDHNHSEGNEGDQVKTCSSPHDLDCDDHDPAVGEAAVSVGHDPALQQQQGEPADSPPDVSVAGKINHFFNYFFSLVYSGACFA